MQRALRLSRVAQAAAKSTGGKRKESIGDFFVSLTATDDAGPSLLLPSSSYSPSAARSPALIRCALPSPSPLSPALVRTWRSTHLAR